MACDFVWCASKRGNEMKKKDINNWRAKAPTLEIKFIKADKLSMTAAARLANKYSNKSAPRGNSCIAALNFSFIGRWSKLRDVARTPSRRRRGNSLRIKITLERKLRRGFFIFRREWFTRFGARARAEEGRDESPAAFAVSLIRGPRPSGGFLSLSVPTVNKATARTVRSRVVELAKF